MHSRERLTKRTGYRILIDLVPCHLGEEGMKHHVIFTIENHNLTLVRFQSFAQRFCAGYSGKSSTDNYDSLWWHSNRPWFR